MKDIQEAHSLRFKTVSDNDSGKVMLTEPYNIEDFYPVRYYIRVMYTEYWNEEWEHDVGKYHVDFGVVSPAALSEQSLESMASSFGMSMDQLKELGSEALACEAIESGGHGVPFWQGSGNNLRDLLRTARAESVAACMLFGFYMDRGVNAIGTSGWDWARGNILGGLTRSEAPV